MHREIPRAAKRLYLIGAAILAAGLLAAAALYVFAPETEDEGLGYEFIDGQAYVVQASDSKAYRHELERFGGKAAVFADDLNRWFSGLWHGRQLAHTVGWLSLAVALAFFRAGWVRAQRDAPPEDRADD